MNVNYSKSNQCFTDKEQAKQQLKNVCWENVTTSLTELADNLKSGYTINGSYNGEHTLDNLTGRQFIAIDVDYTDMCMEDAVKAVTVARLQPTIYYYTYSANPDSRIPDYRYRLIYVLDEEVDADKWQTISNAIYDSVKEITGCFLDENCNRVTQNTFGTDKSVYVTDSIYSIDKLLRCPVFPLYYHPTTINSIAILNNTSATEQDRTIVDMFNTSKTYREFIDLVISLGWTPITHTEIEWEDGQVAQAINQTNFCEIYHTWFINEDGKRQIKRLKDGEQRRPTFNNWLYLLRICKHNITLGELLCNAVFLIVHYLDNSDGVFTKRYVLECCQKALRRNLTYKGYKGDRKYITNKQECQRQGISTQKAVGQLRHNQLTSDVMGMYDMSDTIDNNLINIKNAGVKISRTTLYRILKEEGIVCDKECLNDTIKQLINLNLSVRKNKVMLEEKGIKISIGKLNGIITELKCSNLPNTI